MRSRPQPNGDITLNKMQLKNDHFRQVIITQPSTKGKFVLTRGVASLTPYDRKRVLQAVRTFNNFTEDNDPHKEHDFGSVELAGVPEVFWKIDYFENESMDFDPESPFGETQEDFIHAYRLLTIMLADEY